MPPGTNLQTSRKGGGARGTFEAWLPVIAPVSISQCLWRLSVRAPDPGSRRNLDKAIGLVGVPMEPEFAEAVTPLTDERVVLADNSERAEREGLEVSARSYESWRLFFDASSVAEGGQSVQPRRKSRESEAEVMAGGRFDRLSERLKIPTEERKAKPRRLEREVIPLHAQCHGGPLEFGGAMVISHDRACNGTDQQRPRVPRARSVEVCGDGLFDAHCQRPNCLPSPGELLDFELEGQAV